MDVLCFHHAGSCKKLILCDLYMHPTSVISHASVSRFGISLCVSGLRMPPLPFNRVAGVLPVGHRATETKIPNPWLIHVTAVIVFV